MALDIGTTNIKAAVISSNGSIEGLAKVKSPIISADSGVFEHNPKQLINEVLNIIKSLTVNYGDRVKAIALSSYISSLLLVDGEGNEITNIITWLDSRSVKVLDDLRKLVDVEELYIRTGCPPLYLYVLPKILLIKNTSNLLNRAKYILDAKSYVISKLIGEAFIDLSTASASQLLNIHKLRWDDLILGILGIDEGMLPKLVEADNVVGYIPRSKALELGLHDEVPVIPCTYDGASFIVGMGGFKVGIGSSHIGTSAMLRVISDKPILDLERMELQTYYLYRGLWIPGGAIGNAGLVIEWLSKLVGKSIDDILKELSTPLDRTPISIPILTPERFPKLTKCSGLLSYGMRLEDGLNTLTTSLILGFLFMLKRIAEVIEAHGIKLHEVRVGGGVARSHTVLDLMSNVLGTQILRPKDLSEAGLVGNALMAFKALGRFKSLDEGFKSINMGFDVFVPRDDVVRVSNELYVRFKKLLKIYEELCSELP